MLSVNVSGANTFERNRKGMDEGCPEIRITCSSRSVSRLAYTPLLIVPPNERKTAMTLVHSAHDDIEMKIKTESRRSGENCYDIDNTSVSCSRAPGYKGFNRRQTPWHACVDPVVDLVVLVLYLCMRLIGQTS